MTTDIGTLLVLGGSSPWSTRHYYQLLDDEVKSRLGQWNSAPLVINSINFQESVELVRREDWPELGNRLRKRTDALVSAVEFCGLITASNTWHASWPILTDGLSIPCLHIADCTAVEIQEAGFDRVALFGTRQTMTLDFMKDRYRKFGIEVIVPDREEDLKAIDDIIFNELVYNTIREESRMKYLEIASRVRMRGAQGLILGCTEIPLLLSQEHDPDLRMFNCTTNHTKAAIDLAQTGHWKQPIEA